MAEGKKSFIAYADWKETFDNLPNEVAGKLIKHIFAYVNDENPNSDDFVINAVFANIKNALKRDLDKWENQLEQRREAGKKSAELRALTKSNERSNSLNETERNPTDSVNVNDNVSVSDNESVILLKKETKKSLLSEIKISDLKKDEIEYFEIASAYQKLFIKNLKEKNAPYTNQEKATYKNYVDPIRLMMTIDGVTKEQLTLVYKFLGSLQGEFWKPNILSTSKLREKFQQLLLKSQENGKSGNNYGGNTTPTTSELAEQSYNAVAKLLGRTQ